MAKIQHVIEPIKDAYNLKTKLLYILEQIKEAEVMAEQQNETEMVHILYIAGVEIGSAYNRLSGTT